MWIVVFLIFVALPLLELALLIKLGQSLGLWPTVAIIFATAGLGVIILQYQGLTAFRRMNENMRAGRPPVEPMVEGILLLLAAGMLIAPGVITDTAGLLLLISPLRRAFASWGAQRIAASGTIDMRTWRQSGRGGQPERGRRPAAGTGPGPVIDGEFERLDDPSKKPPVRDDKSGTEPPSPAKPDGNGATRDP